MAASPRRYARSRAWVVHGHGECVVQVGYDATPSLSPQWSFGPAATQLSLMNVEDLTSLREYLPTCESTVTALGFVDRPTASPRSEEIRLRAGSRQTDVRAGPRVRKAGKFHRQSHYRSNGSKTALTSSLPSLRPSLLPRSACAARQNGNSIRPNQLSSLSADPRTTLVISLRSSGVRDPPTPIH